MFLVSIGRLAVKEALRQKGLTIVSHLKIPVKIVKILKKTAAPNEKNFCKKLRM